jgi:hypothetical protein
MKGRALAIRDLIVGEKKEDPDGEAHDTQDRAPILEALRPTSGPTRHPSTFQATRAARPRRALSPEHHDPMILPAP